MTQLSDHQLFSPKLTKGLRRGNFLRQLVKNHWSGAKQEDIQMQELEHRPKSRSWACIVGETGT